MSDAEKTKVNEKMDDVKQDLKVEHTSTPRENSGTTSVQDDLKTDVEKKKHNEPTSSVPAENSGTTNPQDDNQRKYLEAMFKYKRDLEAMQMWNIFNSK